MSKRRHGLAGAGESASAEWRRARSSARRRLPLSITLAVVAAALGAAAFGAAALGAAAFGAAAFGAVAWAARAGRPALWVAGAALLTALAARRIRPRPDADRWRRGAEGEVATAVLLEGLPRRWVVLHDRAVPGSRANIDHLVISSTGVWVVDTKTARAALRVRRGAVWAGEYPIDTGPASWEAEVVSERLGVEATPIVAVHGEGLRRRGKVSGGVRVVPATQLVRRLRCGRRVLTRAEVAGLGRRAGEVLPPR